MTKKNRKAITVALIAIIPLFFGSKFFKSLDVSSGSMGATTIAELYQNRQSGLMVKFEGVIVKILSDDNDGSRHQRFIVELSDQHTVLIAHNIDVAPRVPIKKNKRVTIYGQYEWNDRGGVVHWTHGDLYGNHEEGWIEFQGEVYQ